MFWCHQLQNLYCIFCGKQQDKSSLRLKLMKSGTKTVAFRTIETFLGEDIPFSSSDIVCRYCMTSVTNCFQMCNYNLAIYKRGICSWYECQWLPDIGMGGVTGGLWEMGMVGLQGTSSPPIRKDLHLSYPLSDALPLYIKTQLNPLCGINVKHTITGDHKYTRAVPLEFDLSIQVGFSSQWP